MAAGCDILAATRSSRSCAPNSKSGGGAGRDVVALDSALVVGSNDAVSDSSPLITRPERTWLVSIPDAVLPAFKLAKHRLSCIQMIKYAFICSTKYVPFT